MNPTRRSVLRDGAGVLALSALAGCLSAPADEGDADGHDGYAAFFALWDWATQVGGDRFAFENPVGVGESGHGWSPGGTLVADVASTDAFVYLDSPAFRWASDLAAQLEADYDDVAAIDGLAGLSDDQFLAAADHDDDDDDGQDDDDHAEEDHDPHVWVDPVLAGEIVATIADGLAAVDPDGADAYADNADAYRDRLASLDRDLAALVESAERDVAVLAGHDSFAYLERRYGFDLHTPAGVSPDESPSQSAIADTIDLVDETGIEAILYDPFDAPAGDLPPLAETIVAHSDATDAVPISATQGTLASWADEGWGWLDQMREVNLPSLRAALDAEI